jgi:hypothetical protein
MNHKLRQCLEMQTGKHSPAESPVGRIPVEEGKNLPNSETEDVGGFSLCPSYSNEQLRRIERLRIKESRTCGISDLETTLKLGGRLRW